jgi:hypothetical protein
MKEFWQIAPLQQCLTQKPVNDVQYKQCAVIDFLVADKQSMKNIHKVFFAMLMEVLWSTDARLVTRWKE